MADPQIRILLSNEKEQTTDNAATLMNLQSIRLSERSQIQISTYYMTSLTWYFRKHKITGARKPVVFTRSWVCGRDGRQQGHEQTLWKHLFLDCVGGYLTICDHPILSN